MEDYLDALEAELGPIIMTEQLCPGVCYLAVKYENEGLIREYYAVTDTPVISQAARAYGHRTAGLWLFPMEADTGGWRVVRDEITKYLKKTACPWSNRFWTLRCLPPSSPRNISALTPSRTTRPTGVPRATGFWQTGFTGSRPTNARKSSPPATPSGLPSCPAEWNGRADTCRLTRPGASTNPGAIYFSPRS